MNNGINLNLSRAIFNDLYYPHLFSYDKRYEVYFGGAGSGKSVFVFQKIILKALKSKRKILVVRKTGKSNRDSTFQLCLDTLSSLKLLQYCEVNKSFMTIRLPNKTDILFYGLDDVEKLKSIVGITDIICEEATELTHDDVTQLDLRLRAKESNLQMYFMFNPVSKANWVYKRWFHPEVEEAAANDPNTFILRSTWKDNKFLPKSYIQSLQDMKITNPVMYRVYTMGEFASLDKLVYNNWIMDEFDYLEFRNFPLLVGMDFGFVNDPSTIVASLLDEENKTIYVFNEWGAKGKTNDELAKIVESLGYSKSVIIADSAEKKSIEEMRLAGIRRIKGAKKGADSIVHGIQRLQQYRLVVHPSCSQVINELQNYAWTKDKQSGEYINKPIDNFNHYLDALRYSLQCAGVGRIKVLPRNIL